MSQLNFSFTKHFKKEHGGSLQKGKRKSARPLSAKNPLHLVLKSSHSAFFNPSLRVLEKLIYDQAAKYRIKIYGLSLNWSHLHAVIQVPDRASYTAFIRTLTAEIVKLLSKLKGQDCTGLFDLSPSRIVSWGRELKTVLEYVVKNQLQAWGLISKTGKTKTTAGQEQEGPARLGLPPGYHPSMRETRPPLCHSCAFFYALGAPYSL